MRLKSKMFILVVGISIVIAGCSGGENINNQHNEDITSSSESNDSNKDKFPRKVMGGYGEIEVKTEPKRIVTTNYEDNVLALGLTPLGSHRNPDDEDGHFDYLGEQLKDVELVGDYNAFNFEKMISLQPDLIISTKYDYDEEKYKDLSKVAPVLTIDFTTMSWQEVHMVIGQALGKENEAKDFIDKYNKREAEVKEKLKAALEGKNVTYINPNENNFWVWGTKTSNDVGPFLYQTIGLEPTPGLTDDGGELTLEGLASLDPDVLFVSNSYYSEEYKESAIWKNLKAVKNDQVYTLDKDFRIKMYYPIGASQNLEELVSLLK
ncbi:ABC transporter substrate-binding protein [Paenibacillus sp. YIM B09110]|uniref:ABC transporter substrate-binding protein n=1 Tax=Paenibacillus sp. YIM B09110 TaxID=3126102 RepID=UPI00301DAA40